LIFVPLRFFRLLVLFEPEIVAFPSGPTDAPSRRESNSAVLLTLIVALVVLLPDRVVELVFVLVVPLVVAKVGDLTVVVVVPLVVDTVGALAVVVVVLAAAVVTAAGGGSLNAGALLSG
jgi:hypothetical protein